MELKDFIKDAEAGKIGVQNGINKLFEEYVSIQGPAETVLGEIVRATCRIGYRCYNDGDCIGVGYGKKTCNAPARYLIEMCGSDVEREINNLWGKNYNPNDLEDLEDLVLSYICDQGEKLLVKNTDDMLKYDDKDDYRYDEEDE